MVLKKYKNKQIYVLIIVQKVNLQHGLILVQFKLRTLKIKL